MEVEATHGIPASTQRVWRCTNRYGFRDLVIKLGRKVAYDRKAFEAWIDSRRQRGGQMEAAIRQPGQGAREGPESTGGDGSHPQNKAPLPAASRRRARVAEEASQMEAATRQPGQGAEAGEG
jgi:hypothetical protein